MRFIAAFCVFSKSTQNYRILSFGWIMWRVQPARKTADTSLRKLRIEIEWVKE
jgi:hypothetical protein